MRNLPSRGKLIEQFGLDENRFVNGPEIGMAYRVDKLPYAVLLDDAGVIAAKGWSTAANTSRA